MNIDSKIGYFIDIEGMISGTSRMRVLFVFLIVIFLSSGCNVTKYVPDDGYLLKKNEYNIKGGDLRKREIKNYAKQTPNKKILGFRFHLRMYNLANPQKDNWFHNWLRKIGEPPVVLNELMMERSSNQFRQLYINNGYYNVNVVDTSILKKHKAKVIYTVYANEPYTINKKEYLLEDTSLSRFFYPDTLNSFIKSGHRYQFEVLQEERKRIEKEFNNEGFYKFSKEFVHYKLDSALGKNQVDVLTIIKVPKNSNGEIDQHKRYFIESIKIYPDESLSTEVNDGAYLDTVNVNNIDIIYSQNRNMSPKLLAGTNKILKDSIYRLDNTAQTYSNISSLRMFRFINIDYSEGTSSQNGLYPLNAEIRLVPHEKQRYEIRGEFTNSGGNFGLGGNFDYQQKNIFRGAEILDLNFNMTNQWHEKLNDNGYDNYANYGLEAQLMFPKLIVPFAKKIYRKNYTTKTSVNVGYEYQNWPFYAGTISNVGIGYNWKSGKFLTHYLNPIDINSVKATNTKALNQRYAGNEYLLSIYNSHFVGVTNYSFVYNNQQINKKQQDYTFFKFNLETAGNLLTTFNNFLGTEKNDSGRFEIFGLEYAQYIKADIDLRQSFQTSGTNNFVYRIFAGVGFPYNNSEVLPFERQYYSGGANGMRAWRVWSLGPGSHFNDSIYNTGDIKLEFNLEHRFKMFWILEGALFLDIGNIWSIADKDPREGVHFKFDSFYEDLAVGTGFGLRIDLPYIQVLRFDIGLKLRDPSIGSSSSFNETQNISINNTSKFVLGNPNLREGYNFLAFQIGLGYPF